MEGPGPSRSSIIPWVVVGVALLLVGLTTLPGLFSSGRVENDRRSWSRLKMLTCAETDFRANDRDWNHVNDYWTGDVKSLYTLTSAAIPGTKGEPDDPPLKLIERSMAAADADGRLVPAAGENSELSTYTLPAPREGYWYAALERDLGDGSLYRQDTGGKPPMGLCHNLLKFGFVAFPDSLSAGTMIYIVNENCMVYRSAVTGATRSGTSLPPGWDGIDPALRDWPAPAALKSTWGPAE
jgi:hypothetical protein